MPKPGYTAKEVQIIRENAGKMSPKQLHALLPGRSLPALYNYLREHKIASVKRGYSRTYGYISDDQAEIILSNYRQMNINQIAKEANVSYNAVKRFLENRGLTAISAKEQAVKHKQFFKPQKNTFTRPPAQYSNTDWSKMYL